MVDNADIVSEVLRIDFSMTVMKSKRVAARLESM